jgi:predicted TIM-barrel fold metal-dependent hydrolase
MSIKDLQAIDVHAHLGVCRGSKSKLLDELRSGDAETVLRRAQQANTCLTIVSPTEALMPRFKANPVKGNEEAARIIAQTEGLLQWVVVDPLKPGTYEQAADMLALPKCVGIKVHPEEHGYAITEQGTAIFEFAARHRTTIITHSGEENSMPEDFVKFANEFPEVTLIIAHLGLGWDGDPTHHVRAIQNCKHGNVFVDTSSALNITPGLIEWAVKEIGAQLILYGTDSPLYFAPMQRARIDYADIRDQDKKLILCDNAKKLFRIPDKNDNQRNKLRG